MSGECNFDCMAYKRAIQEKLFQESAGLTLEEEARQRAVWLATSDNPAAALWRELEAKSTASHVS